MAHLLRRIINRNLNAAFPTIFVQTRHLFGFGKTKATPHNDRDVLASYSLLSKDIQAIMKRKIFSPKFEKLQSIMSAIRSIHPSHDTPSMPSSLLSEMNQFLKVYHSFAALNLEREQQKQLKIDRKEINPENISNTIENMQKQDYSHFWSIIINKQSTENFARNITKCKIECAIMLMDSVNIHKALVEFLSQSEYSSNESRSISKALLSLEQTTSQAYSATTKSTKDKQKKDRKSERGSSSISGKGEAKKLIDGILGLLTKDDCTIIYHAAAHLGYIQLIKRLELLYFNDKNDDDSNGNKIDKIEYNLKRFEILRERWVLNELIDEHNKLLKTNSKDIIHSNDEWSFLDVQQIQLKLSDAIVYHTKNVNINGKDDMTNGDEIMVDGNINKDKTHKIKQDISQDNLDRWNTLKTTQSKIGRKMGSVLLCRSMYPYQMKVQKKDYNIFQPKMEQLMLCGTKLDGKKYNDIIHLKGRLPLTYSSLFGKRIMYLTLEEELKVERVQRTKRKSTTNDSKINEKEIEYGGKYILRRRIESSKKSLLNTNFPVDLVFDVHLTMNRDKHAKDDVHDVALLS